MSSKSNNTAPIKINTSMTEIAVNPKHDIGPLSSSLCSSRRGDLTTPRSPRTPWSPQSPVSPKSVSPSSSLQNAATTKKVKLISAKSPYSAETSMKKRGYIPFKPLASTLQGCVWKVKSSKSKQPSIVKVTKKSLHNKQIAVINGTEIGIKEDIIKETAILRYLSSNNPPKSLAKFEYFFSDKKNYFLVQEDGGTGLFEFVAKCHQFIDVGQLSIKEWHRFCKIAFKQMVELLHWMHNKMNCCHLDISLENFVIKNVMVQVEPNTNQIRFADGFCIKIIDFGLAEVFTSSDESGDVDFRCTKYVGKTAYKSPKVYNKKKVFDARSADCWSLGVVLFMMVIGGAPYKKPSKNDACFGYIMSGKIIELLDKWNRVELVTATLLDLILRIFQKEEDRLNIDEIKKHPWLL